MSKQKKVMTIALIRVRDKMLMGRKKKKGFGYSKWNGFGGKVELGETVNNAMIREVQEEVGLEVLGYVERGKIFFHYVADPDMETHIYEVSAYVGTPHESKEMEWQWFDIDKLPYSEMWADDAFWMPLFLARKKFEGEFDFDDKYNIVSHTIKENK